MNDALHKREYLRATEYLRNPIGDAELQKQVGRGNLLVYERASDAQLIAREKFLEQRLVDGRMPFTDITRHVGANMLYAMASITASLWFAGAKALQAFPSVSRWLVDKNFLRDGVTNFPYVAQIKEFEEGIISMAANWGHDAVGNSDKAAAKRLNVVETLRDTLKDNGFNRSAEVLSTFLEEHKGKAGLSKADVFDDLLGRLKAADEAAANKKGVKYTESMATKVIGFFAKAEDMAKKGGSALMHSKLKSDLSYNLYGAGGQKVSPAAISQRIYNNRMGPVIVGVAAVGAAAAGVFSYNAARERRAMLSATDLTFIDQVQQQREDYRHPERDENQPSHKVDASNVQHEQTVDASPRKQLAH